MIDWTLNKFLYKWTPITISLSDSWKSVSVKNWDTTILQNFQNKKWASLEQLTNIVKKYLDLNNDSIKLSDFISSELTMSSFKWTISDDNWFWDNKEYIFGERPSGLTGYVKELINLLEHIVHYPKARNIQEINDNITGICDWVWQWDWIWFDELYYSNKDLFFRVKDLVQEIALKYPYTNLDSGTSCTIHYMINQGNLFDNSEFTKQEWAENAKFLDTLVENGTISRILSEKRLSWDYKMVMSTRIEQYSNFKWGTDELTKSWTFGGDWMKDLTAKDYLGVIFSDFEKEIIKSDWQTFLNFKIALFYFNNLKRSQDSITTILDDIGIIFNSFKSDKTISQIKWMSGPEQVKEVAKWFVKHIIVKKLLESWVLIDYLREKNLSWQYYWDLDDASYSKLFTVLSRTEWIKNSTKVELEKKSQGVNEVFNSLVEWDENKFVNVSSNITRVNMTKTILEKLLSWDSITSSLSIEELLKLLSESKESDQDSIIQTVYGMIKSKSHFDKLVTPIFQSSPFSLQTKLIFNLTYLSDINSCDNFIDTLSDDTLLDLFGKLKWKTILITLLSLLDDNARTGRLLVTKYIKSKEVEYLQLLIDNQKKYTSKENYESVVLSFTSKNIDSKTVLNFLESCGTVDLGKNILQSIEDLWIKQIMYEYLKSKWEKDIEKQYIKDVLDKSNYNNVTSEIDLSSLDNIIKSSNTSIKETLLTILESLKDSKVDSYKYLNLINEKWYLDELSDSERLWFYVEFIKHLNNWDYESEQLALSDIYKKIFSEKDSWAITSKIIERFEVIKSENDSRVKKFGELLKQYSDQASTKKSVFKSFLWSITWSNDSRSLDEIYKDLLNELQWYKVGLEQSTKVFKWELTEVVSLMWQLNSFKELLSKSELKDSSQFLNGIQIFEWNLVGVQKRLELYLTTFSWLTNTVWTLYEKIKWLDTLVGIQVIEQVNVQLQEKLKALL